LREIVDQGFGDAVAQIFGVGVGAVIGEGQHGYRLDGLLVAFREHRIDRSDETVTLARNGFNECWRLTRIPQSLPQLTDRRIDSHFDVNEDTGIPQPLCDVGPGDELTTAFYEEDEQVHRMALKVDRLPASAQLVSRYIELELTKSKP